VVITGIGVLSPIGIGRQAYWDGLVRGENGIREIRGMNTTMHRTHRGGEVADFDGFDAQWSEEELRLGRASKLAIAASQQAWNDSGLADARISPRRIGVACGTTNGESQIFEEEFTSFMNLGSEGIDVRRLEYFPVDVIGASIARRLHVQGPVSTFTTACAAGNYAIGNAADLLRAGAADVMIAGGADMFSQTAFTGFNSLFAVAPECCQPFDRFRRGMCVSEGAAIMTLETLSNAKQRGAHIYAEVLACGISNDAHHATAPHPEGRGAVTAMHNAIREAGIALEDVDYISAHGTGTPANDKVETLAVKRVFGDRAYRIPMSSIKSMLGHTMGAASALEAVACVMAIRHGVIPPTINYREPDPLCDLDYVPNQTRQHTVRIALSNAFAFGGNCSTLILADHARQ
jgi:3-oxoacyl-[acyl-carrier-protein] synthase II